MTCTGLSGQRVTDFWLYPSCMDRPLHTLKEVEAKPRFRSGLFFVWQAATDPGSKVIKGRLGEGLRELQHISHAKGATARQTILEGDTERALGPTSPQVCTVCKNTSRQ